MKFDLKGAVLSHRERALLNILEEEYTDNLVVNVLSPLITSSSGVSLRTLDWAVVNFAKCKNIVCSGTDAGSLHNIYLSYKSTLTYWKRKLFDPFRRRQRIEISSGNTKVITTLGQANFVLWAYKTGVIQYTFSNIDKIVENMKDVSKDHKKKKRDKKNAGCVKSQSITSKVQSNCCAYVHNTRISF
jgi:hypothetical protein